jgi:hypothetical protein
MRQTEGVRWTSTNRRKPRRSLLISLQLPLAPMGLFPLGLELTQDMTVQRPHDSDPRHHRGTASRNQQQYFDRCLPFRQVGFLFRQAGDVVGCVTKRDERLAAGQRFGSSNVRCPPASATSALGLRNRLN